MRWMATVVLLAMPLVGGGRGAVAAAQETPDEKQEALWRNIGGGQGLLPNHPLVQKLSSMAIRGSLNGAACRTPASMNDAKVKLQPFLVEDETPDAMEEVLWDEIGKGQGSMSHHPLARKLSAWKILGALNEAASRIPTSMNDADVEPQRFLVEDEIEEAEEDTVAEPLEVEDDVSVPFPDVGGEGVAVDDWRNRTRRASRVLADFRRNKASLLMDVDASRCSRCCCSWPGGNLEVTGLRRTWDAVFPTSGGIVVCTTKGQGSKPAAADGAGAGLENEIGEAAGCLAVPEGSIAADTLPTCVVDDMLEAKPVAENEPSRAMVLVGKADQQKAQTDPVLSPDEVQLRVVLATVSSWNSGTVTLALLLIVVLVLLAMSEARRMRESAAARRQLDDLRRRTEQDRGRLMEENDQEQHRGAADRHSLVQERDRQRQRDEETRARLIRHHVREARELRRQIRQEQDRQGLLERAAQVAETRRARVALMTREVQQERQQERQQRQQEQQQWEQQRQQEEQQWEHARQQHENHIELLRSSMKEAAQGMRDLRAEVELMDSD